MSDIDPRTVAVDATYTFDRTGPDGRVVDADTLARVTAANVHGEFADVISTADLLVGSSTDPGLPS